ncbi:MAG: RecX family transcriptional regulator [Actinomycetota bacterium]
MTDTSEEEAFEKACGFLSYRQRTEQEMARYLDRRGCGDVRDAVIARLVRAGLIDDQVFAETWISERAGSQGYGSRRLRSELLRLGVRPSLIDETLESVYPNDREDDRAAAIAARQWPRISGKNPYDRGRKLYSYLIRRGYENQAAKEAVDSLMRADKESE